MSLEDFQVIDNSTVDTSIDKRDFTQIYHQQGARLNHLDQNIEFILGENNKYHQIGNAYLQYDITVRKVALPPADPAHPPNPPNLDFY